jgi:hypothetical protein
VACDLSLLPGRKSSGLNSWISEVPGSFMQSKAAIARGFAIRSSIALTWRLERGVFFFYSLRRVSGD